MIVETWEFFYVWGVVTMLRKSEAYCYVIFENIPEPIYTQAYYVGRDMTHQEVRPHLDVA